ncbi:hypothetical protein GCM10007170_35080 [Arthrobacter liuii]|uniref:Uncharacterized protein n=1 Tax=Arthrobacter liuii TaxID=1476996 RepID=A0ABQ2AW38_9MICC|nr:hypothetical protein GCM10007170_35080 [Arthrobacter liuii]
MLQRQQSTVPVEALRATLTHRLKHTTTEGPASTAADTSMIRPKPHPRPEREGEATAYFLPPRRASDAKPLTPGSQLRRVYRLPAAGTVLAICVHWALRRG